VVRQSVASQKRTCVTEVSPKLLKVRKSFALAGIAGRLDSFRALRRSLPRVRLGHLASPYVFLRLNPGQVGSVPQSFGRTNREPPGTSKHLRARNFFGFLVRAPST
jgi:hypothetical protein